MVWQRERLESFIKTSRYGIQFVVTRASRRFSKKFLGQPRRSEGTINSRNFFSELKRRNVYKVAVAYAVVAWLLIQIATQVFPFFEIPNWAVRLIVLAMIAGFPIALIIAWAFELTPEGIKRTEDADATAKSSRGRAWIYVAIVGAFLSVGLFILGRYTASRPGVAEGARAFAAAGSIPAKSIAILPFENLSEEKQMRTSPRVFKMRF